MNVLVTGGAGFIGSHLIERLLAEGHSCVCLDNFDDFYDPAAKQRNLRPVEGNRSFTLVRGDIRSAQDLDAAFDRGRVDLVVHLAARAGVRESVSQPGLYYDVNVRGTLNVLEAMKKHGVTGMIFASSSSVYGDDAPVPFREDQEADQPRSPYAASKRSGELLCHAFHHMHGMQIACLRLFSLFGARQRPGMAIRKFMERMLDGRPVVIYGDGSSQRDYTSVHDAVHGMIAAVGCLNGFEIVNIGSGRPVGLSDLVDLLEKVTGRTAIRRKGPANSAEMQVTSADITRAKKLYGYSPSEDFESGLRVMAEWLLNERNTNTMNEIPEGRRR